MVTIKSKVQDAENKENFKQLSMMSKLVNILFKIGFIPVKKDDNEKRFHSSFTLSRRLDSFLCTLHCICMFSVKLRML